MKIAGKTISMVGVGVGAIAIVGLVFFMRSRSGASDDGGGSLGVSGGFPYFQTAALPGGSGATYQVVDSSAASDQLLLDKISQMQSDANAATVQTTFGQLLAGMFSQQSAQLANANDVFQGESAITRGFFKPTEGGGFEFGVDTVPVLFTSASNWDTMKNKASNSTNSTTNPPVVS